MSNYYIKDTEFMFPNCVVLKHPAFQRIIGYVLSLSGVLITVAGSVMWVKNMWLDPVPIPVFIVALGMIDLGIAISLGNSSNFPDKFVYDNKKGMLQVLQNPWDSEDIAVGVPYQDIEGFYLKEKKNQSSNGFTYAVQMNKHDGSIWTLYESGNEKSAMELYEHLKKNVNLKTRASSPVLGTNTGHFDVFQNDKETVIKWKKSYGLRYLFSLLFISGGISIGVVSVPVGQELNAWIWMRWIIVILVGSPILTFLSSLSTYHTIKIDSKDFSSFFRGMVGKHLIKTPIQEIVSVMFNFSSNQAEGSMIFIKREDEMREIIDISNTPHILTFDIVRTLYNIFKESTIYCKELSVAQKIYLQQLIKQTLIKHGHHSSQEKMDLLKQFQEVSQKKWGATSLGF